MAEDKFVQLNTKDGGWVNIAPSFVRAVVPAEGGGTLIWYGHGHEVVVKDESKIVLCKLGLPPNNKS